MQPDTAKVTTRFAPSPTGLLHLGHAWSALLAHDLARAAGGRFLLRIEDIDLTRCRPHFVEAIYQDLSWLGLEWDGPVIVQSARLAHYARALDQLIALGLVYKCWCTRADIARASEAPQGTLPPPYPRTCKGRADTDDERPYCWRLDAQGALGLTGALLWHDDAAGSVMVSLDQLGDVVLFRKDAPASYHLSVTLDDAAQGVTDIVRGRDLFGATHVHRLLQALLDLPVPQYHHHRLIVGTDGVRLAKRLQSPSLASLREAGTNPKVLVDALRAGRFPIGFKVEAG